MRSDPEMEAIGMQVAMQYEREHGREPEDVSSENLGHDIRSTTPSGQVRCIEVKARATTGAIVLTLNEWLMAQGLRDEDWLYIFENPRTDPRLHTIENPAAKLQPGENHRKRAPRDQELEKWSVVMRFVAVPQTARAEQ
jgi:hypothetical protein